MALVTPNLSMANALAVLVTVLQTLTMGFLISPPSLPAMWKWMYWVNPFRYLFQGMVVSDLHGETFAGVVPGTGGQVVMVSGDAILAERTWSYDQLWWYCYVAVVGCIVLLEILKLLACRYISFLKR